MVPPVASRPQVLSCFGPFIGRIACILLVTSECSFGADRPYLLYPVPSGPGLLALSVSFRQTVHVRVLVVSGNMLAAIATVQYLR